MQPNQLIQLSSAISICLCTAIVFYLYLKSKTLHQTFIQQLERSHSRFKDEIQSLMEESSERNLKTLATACSDGTKLLENKHRFLFENSLEAFRDTANDSRNELRKEISLYREELLQSLYEARNQTEQYVLKVKDQAAASIVEALQILRKDIETKSQEYELRIKSFTALTTQGLDVFYQQKKCALDIQTDQLKESILEIFPPEKRSVFMNLSKGGMWTNKPDGKTI